MQIQDMNKLIFLLLVVILQLLVYTNANDSIYDLQTVIRIKFLDEADKVTFKGICSNGFCESKNGFSLSSTCQCRCKDKHVFLISQKKCVKASSLVGNFTLFDGTSTQPLVPKITSSELKKGVYIVRENRAAAKNCEIDTVESYIDSLQWDRLWTSRDDTDLEVISSKMESKLQFKASITNQEIYNGLLLKVGLHCDVGSDTINSYAVFEMVGEYTVSNSNPTNVTNVTTVLTSKTGPTNMTTMTTALAPKTDKQGSDEDKMEMLIIAVVLGIFLFASCILLIIMFRRWKQAKNRTNDHMSEPPLSFEATTPVFLVRDRTGKHNTSKVENEKISSNDSMCHISTQDDNKRNGTMRALYASIDKFFKLSSKRRSNVSIDEGYTTDDNYDYRRFSAFPKELYDQPGSIISSFDEPDYRIPEDFDANFVPDLSHMVETDPRYLQPSVITDSNSSDTSSRSSYHNYDYTDEEQTTESPYDEVGEALSEKVKLSTEKLTCPFESGEGNLLTSQSKFTLLSEQKQKQIPVNPYDTVGRVMSTKGPGGKELDKDLENNIKTDLEHPYDQVGVVLAKKIGLSRQTIVEEEIDESSNPYDEVGQIIQDSNKNSAYANMSNRNETSKELKNSTTLKNSEGVEYLEPLESVVEYDVPENEVEYDTPELNNTEQNNTKQRPPKPPRPDSFKVIQRCNEQQQSI